MTTLQMTTSILKALLSGQQKPIIQLLQASYAQPPATSKTLSLLDPQALIETIRTVDLDDYQTLLDAICHQLKTTETLGPLELAIVNFCEQLFSEYTQCGQLHYDIKYALKDLRKNMAIAMLTHHQWPWKTDPNLSTLLQLIHQNCTGWHPQLGRASTRFLSMLTHLITELSLSNNSATFNQASGSLEGFFLAETQRISKLEKRLHDTEKGVLQATHATKVSARILNQLMAGKKLPKSISDFLQGPLRQSLQLLLINNTQDSRVCRDCISLSETLIWSLQPINNDDIKRQHVYQSITQITDKLPDTIISLHHDNALLNSQLSIIEAEHLKVLKGDTLHYEPFDLINNTDPLSSAHTIISSGLLNQVNQLTQGQWFCYQDQESPYIKLSLKLDKTKQLLFTNFFGVKTKYYSFEEFAYKLSSKTITLVSQKDHYQLTGETLVKKLYDAYQNKKQQQATVYAEKQLKLKLKIQTQETARAAALEEAKNLARIQQEARLKIQADAKMAEIARRQAIQQDQQDEKYLDISRLNTGGLVEFYDEMGNSQQLKLAVILQSTGKYVFIDRTGIKRAKKFKDDLAAMLLQGSAKIIDEGSYFENSLEKVVNGMRERRNN